MSQSKIFEFLYNFKIQISKGTVSNFLIKKQDIFHQEKRDLVEAGLQAASYKQLDDTSARVNGENHYMRTAVHFFHPTR